MSLPTLFLPGTLCDERVWLPVWQKLQVHQRRYVPLQWASSMDEMLALTTDRVLAGEKVHLAGFSMGGYIAARWAIDNPDSVASLTMIASSPYGLTTEEEKRRAQLVTMLKRGSFKPDSPAYITRFVHPDHQNNPDVAGVVQDMGKDLGAATLLAHTQATTPRPALTDKLKACSFPVHIIAAADDQVVTAGVLKDAAETIPSASYTPVPDAGHMCLLEQPDTVSRILQSIVD